MGLEDEQRRRERREIIRRHHPDHGGDAEVLVAELAALEARQQSRPGDVPTLDLDSTSSIPEPVRRGLRRASRSAHRAVRSVRAAVPRGWPGHRRYHDISS